jgi:hypothetical protein
MNGYWYCMASKIIAVAGFVTLVIFDYPWWGLMCFVCIATLDGDIKP